MPYPEGVHLDAPGGPHERALTTREARAIDIETASLRCEKAISRAQNLLSHLEDTDHGDTLDRLRKLAEGVEAAAVNAGGRVG